MFYHMSHNINFEIAKTSHCLLQTLDAVTVIKSAIEANQN